MTESNPSNLDTDTRRNHLERSVNPNRDHILGNLKAEMTLVEYGSYTCPTCQEAHKVIINLRDRFGDHIRYVFRHKPLNNEIAHKAAILAEYAGDFYGKFWEVHDAIMKRGPSLSKEDLDEVCETFNLACFDEISSSVRDLANQHVEEDINDAQRSGVILTPTFFINNRRYEGPWDESSLSEALLGSLGHRFHAATVDFVRWGPSAGLMLLMMSMLAIILVNSRIGPDFEAFWASQLGITITNKTYSLSLLDWINDGLLCLFFLVVSLEIKREFTVGRLSSSRAAALPIMASFGGVVIPALIYLTIVPSGPLYIGWGTTISTDTAFAIALIVMLGNKVPVELRIFLTAAAIVDDLISIGVIALFYSETVHLAFIFVSISILLAMIALNRWNFYNPIPYALLGIALWICLYRAGLHPTLTGVLVALIIPTSPPANLMALNAQAQALFKAEALDGKDKLMRNSPSPQTLRILDTIHDRIESPASKLLRTVEPWSSYLILPLFALANAGVVLSFNFHEKDFQLMLAIFLGLLVGKPIGICLGSWLAIEVKLAEKPAAYTWHQLLGAAVLAGMGFTMSLFIASHAFPISNDLSAAKIAIFAASITAGLTGSWIIYRNPKRN